MCEVKGKEGVAVMGLTKSSEDFIPINNRVHKVNKEIKCEVCWEQDSKYTCPACNLRSCCLLCVSKHKEVKKCSGVRDRVKYIAKNEFNNIHLLNDFRFLEDAARLADNAQRDTKIKPVKKHPSKKDEFVKKAVKARGCQWFRMAKGMQRWKENRTFYSVTEDCIQWTMKFVFDEIYETIICKNPETKTFREILAKYLEKNAVDPANRIKYSEYVEREADNEVKVFFKQELELQDDNKRYAEVKLDGTVKEALNNRSILEYPEFRVVLQKNSRFIRNQPFVRDDVMLQEDDEEVSDDEEASLPKKARITTLEHTLNDPCT